METGWLIFCITVAMVGGWLWRDMFGERDDRTLWREYYEDGHTDGYDDGYDDGYRAGYLQCEDDARADSRGR